MDPGQHLCSRSVMTGPRSRGAVFLRRSYAALRRSPVSRSSWAEGSSLGYVVSHSLPVCTFGEKTKGRKRFLQWNFQVFKIFPTLHTDFISWGSLVIYPHVHLFASLTFKFIQRERWCDIILSQYLSLVNAFCIFFQLRSFLWAE